MEINDLKNLFPRFDVDTFDHVLGHVHKAAGKLDGLSGDADHIQAGSPAEVRGTAFEKAEAANGKAASVYIADLIICAAKLAALCPSGEIDLEQAVADRRAEKRDYLNQYRHRDSGETNHALASENERAAIAREVAAYRARQVPETLTREEAIVRASHLDPAARSMIDLDNPRECLRSFDTCFVSGPPDCYAAREIVRAYVRGLDATASEERAS